MSTVLAASLAGALAAFSVEWLFKPRLEIRADTLRARRDVMLVLRYFLQLTPALREGEIWDRAPAEKDRRASLVLDDARKLEALLPRTVRKGWIHWRWPEVASVVSKLSGYIQGINSCPLAMPARTFRRLSRLSQIRSSNAMARPDCSGVTAERFPRRRQPLQRPSTPVTSILPESRDFDRRPSSFQQRAKRHAPCGNGGGGTPGTATQAVRGFWVRSQRVAWGPTPPRRVAPTARTSAAPSSGRRWI